MYHSRLNATVANRYIPYMVGSDVTCLVGYKFGLCNQPIAHLIYCKAWHNIELRLIVGNDIFDNVFLIGFILLMALIGLIGLINLIDFVRASAFYPTSSLRLYLAIDLNSGLHRSPP